MNTNTNSTETSSKSVDDLAEENKMLRSRVIVLESECDLLDEIGRLLHSFQYLQGDAMNNASRDLPSGFIVKFAVEKNGYGIELIDPNGNDVTPELSDGIDDQINYCVEHAKELEK